MRKTLDFLKRGGFLLLLAAVLLGGEAWMRAADPVGHMTCIPRSDYEIIRRDYPDMTFERAVFGSSAVTASYIAGRNETGYVNLGVDYGTVKDITEMLEKGLVTVTDELVLGLNNLSFLDSLPTNETYPWHREWYEPYLYFQRDRLYALITEGVDSVLRGGPFLLRDTSNQQRVVYRGALTDEALFESWGSLVERFGDTGPADCAENFAALDRLAAWCGEHGVRPGYGEYGAEHVVGDVHVHAAGQRHHQHAQRQGAAGDEGDGRVAPDAAALGDAQQQHGREHHHGYGHRQRGPAQGRSHGQRAEAHVREPVAYHGEALEHQRGAQQRGAERNQQPHQHGPRQEGVGQHLQEYHLQQPPLSRRSASLRL